MTFTLSSDLDVAAAAERLAATGRTRLHGIFGQGSTAIHAAMTDPAMLWNRAIRNPYNADVPVAVFENEPPEEQARLIGCLHLGREQLRQPFGNPRAERMCGRQRDQRKRGGIRADV